MIGNDAMGIKVTIVGCGAVVQRLYKIPLQLLEKDGMINVVGLVDRDLSRAQIFRRYFKKASAYDNLLTAINDAHSQLTIVASPATLHAEHTILAMQNHNNVLCEKPMAVTKVQCQQMNETACNTGLKLSIGMIRRYYPSLVRAKKLIENGAIGDVLSFTYREGRQYNWPVAAAEGFQRKGGGGGILLDLGSHVFDTLIWLFGKPRIVAHFDDSMNNGIEGSCVTKLDFEGISGFVHLSWDYDLLNKFIIMGTKAKIIVSLDDLDTIIAMKNDGTPLPLPDVAFPVSLSVNKQTTAVPRKLRDCIYIHIVQLLRSILRDEKPEIGGDDGLSVISAIEECYQVAEPIDMNWLPTEQNTSFKQLHWRHQSWDQ
jgi:predicted dehydrogenase